MEGMWNAAAIVENALVVPQKDKSRITMYVHSTSTPSCIFHRTEYRYLNKNLYTKFSLLFTIAKR